MMTRAIACVIVLAIVGWARAADLRVPQDYPTIQAAINASCTIDRVLIAPGVYYEQIGLGYEKCVGAGGGDGFGTEVPPDFDCSVFPPHIAACPQFDVLYSPDLIADGPPGSVIIDGSRSPSDEPIVFAYGPAQADGDGFVLIQGITFRNGTNLQDPLPGQNIAGRGGALRILSGRMRFERCRFEDNTAGLGGALHAVLAWLEFTECQFVGNAAFEGGAYWSQSESQLAPAITFVNCLFEDNHALPFGSDGYDLEGRGGAAFAQNLPAHTWENCVFRGNSAIDGGAIWASASGHISNCQFECNTAMFRGGAIHASVSDSLTVTSTSFVDNSSTEGGAVLAYGSLGAPTGELNIRNCTFRGNSVDDLIGQFGIFTPYALGGAVSAATSLRATIDQCLFIGNTAQYSGPWPEPQAVGGAVAIAVDGDEELSIISRCTFDGNTAEDGSDFYGNECSHLLIRDSILNSPNPVGFFGFGVCPMNISAQNSIINGSPASLPGSGIIDAAVSFVDPLGPDGVPATGDEDFTPSGGSIALDRADSTGLAPDATDLLGNPRAADDPDAPNQGAGPFPFVDIGAIERQLSPAACPGDLNRDNAVDSTDLNLILAAFGNSANSDDLNTVLGAFGTDCP